LWPKDSYAQRNKTRDMPQTILPKEAKKVFNGVIFDVYQWEQKQFDGSIATWERIKRKNSASVIAEHKGKIIVVREQHPTTEPFTSLPCGFIEEGETALAAAQRELREETGFTSENWEHYTTWQVGEKLYWNEHVYIARNCEKTQKPQLDAGEKNEVELLSWEKFMQFISKDDFRLLNIALHVLRLQQRRELEALKKKIFGKK